RGDRAHRGASVVEADLVDEHAGLAPVAHDFGQRQRVDFHRAKTGDHRIEFDPGLHRVFVVRTRVQALRLVGDQVFHQRHRVVAVRRVARDRRAADVDVGPAAVGGEHRTDHLDRLAPLVLLGTGLGVLHAPDVVGVGDADVADAGEDVAGDVAVA